MPRQRAPAGLVADQRCAFHHDRPGGQRSFGVPETGLGAIGGIQHVERTPATGYVEQPLPGGQADDRVVVVGKRPRRAGGWVEADHLPAAAGQVDRAIIGRSGHWRSARDLVRPIQRLALGQAEGAGQAAVGED